MSADKQTRAINRSHDRRVIKAQAKIWLTYNDPEWLSEKQNSGFRKRKSMNCSCRICRGWARDAKHFRFNLQLEKQGMKKIDLCIGVEEIDLGFMVGWGDSINQDTMSGYGESSISEEEWV